MSRKAEPFARDADLPWEPAGAGIVRKVLTYDDGVMMVRVRFEAGAIGTPHSHPHVQCSLVESGVFDVTISGKTERLGAGDSFLVPPDAVHGAVNVEPGVLLDVFTPMRNDFV
ncbi:cupin domain-containing protein [Bosea caraganae]|uniref:Cupin domain-containing protein n=1 Tax=Bosea caraganae TaxID=2763117 RepID=A0A370KZD6_9HYPH|nr:cupin domain-containing protein [Bosea caraganae]RDJ20370.1 cupin domain-containing protein [Bosea caraganae]RDJ26549.1 cupin domain-containing protein [Bosea caraganae]